MRGFCSSSKAMLLVRSLPSHPSRPAPFCPRSSPGTAGWWQRGRLHCSCWCCQICSSSHTSKMPRAALAEPRAGVRESGTTSSGDSTSSLCPPKQSCRCAACSPLAAHAAHAQGHLDQRQDEAVLRKPGPSSSRQHGALGW